jgi:hypothetical protein
MGRKKKSSGPATPRPNDSWEYKTEIQINGRNVLAGTELKIIGERGRFRFIRFVRNSNGAEWIDVWGGPKGADQWRSFKLDKVKRVHYKNQTIRNLSQEYKEKQAKKKQDLNDSNDQ